MSQVPLSKPPTDESLLAELQDVLAREIPVSAQMGIRVHGRDEGGLVMGLPLDRNRNHQQTAFAGSLNALCTIAGWGTAYLLLRQLECAGTIVIRRSSIRYQTPVDWAEIYARCLPVTDEAARFFMEMLEEKGQAKLDLTVEIDGPERPAVVFQGSYVVLGGGHG